MIVYLNGNFLPEDQACVSVLDRGFLFGDGVYEVIPVYGGRLFRLERHLERLENSLAAIRLENPLIRLQWEKILSELLTLNSCAEDSSVYLQVTRGKAKRDHALPKQVVATVFAMCSPIPLPTPNLGTDGVAAITLEDIRWRYCHIKSISLLPNILLRQQAIDEGAAEAILIRDGKAIEGAASNLFIVKDKLLATPPKSAYLLPGITRDLILELASKHDIPFREQSIYDDDLRHADEVWLTSSTKEILPVTQLDGHRIGTGKPGPLWNKMVQLYQEYKRQLRKLP